MCMVYTQIRNHFIIGTSASRDRGERGVGESWNQSLHRYWGMTVHFTGVNLMLRELYLNFWSFLKTNGGGFPGGAVVENLPANARGHGFEPWSGKIPHAAEQLGPWATTTELARLEPVLRNKRDRDSERPAHRDEEWPPLAATRESPRRETKSQHSQK